MPEPGRHCQDHPDRITHMPIAHHRVLDEVISGLDGLGLEIQEAEYALSPGPGKSPEQRFFGLLQVAPKDDVEGSMSIFGAENPHKDTFGLLVGVRNGHDRQCSAAIALGSRVFICDNLALNGQIEVARKHTLHIERDFPGKVQEAVAKLVDVNGLQNKRFDAYMGTEIDNRVAHDVIVRGLRAGVLSSSKVQKVVNEWHTPRHEEFRERTAWSLFNAHTEVLKEYRIQDLSRRTTRLYGIMDQVAGLPTWGKVVDEVEAENN
jgi:hypothetical protein